MSGIVAQGAGATIEREGPVRNIARGIVSNEWLGIFPEIFAARVVGMGRREEERGRKRGGGRRAVYILALARRKAPHCLGGRVHVACRWGFGGARRLPPASRFRGCRVIARPVRSSRRGAVTSG